MSVVFEPINKVPEHLVDQNIVLNGRSIGRVEPGVKDDGSIRYLAILDGGLLVGGLSVGCSVAHGDTPEEAVQNALSSGRSDAQAALDYWTNLGAELGEGGAQ